MPYELLYEWSEPRPNPYDETFHNSTRRELNLKGYTFYMDEYDLDASVYGQETHWLDLRVVNNHRNDHYLIDHFESYEALENALGIISEFISDTAED